MAAHITAVIHDGIIDIPEEAQSNLGFRNGSTVRVETIPSPSDERIVDVSAWRKLKGIFADYPGDANASLDEERRRELQKEAQ